MMNRGKAVPGGVCGFWGACGAGISTGMFTVALERMWSLISSSIFDRYRNNRCCDRIKKTI